MQGAREHWRETSGNQGLAPAPRRTCPGHAKHLELKPRPRGPAWEAVRGARQQPGGLVLGKADEGQCIWSTVKAPGRSLCRPTPSAPHAVLCSPGTGAAAAGKPGSARWLTHDGPRVLTLMSGLWVPWNGQWQHPFLISSVSQLGQEQALATVQSAENRTHLPGGFEDRGHEAGPSPTGAIRVPPLQIFIHVRPHGLEIWLFDLRQCVCQGTTVAALYDTPVPLVTSRKMILKLNVSMTKQHAPLGPDSGTPRHGVENPERFLFPPTPPRPGAAV